MDVKKQNPELLSWFILLK